MMTPERQSSSVSRSRSSAASNRCTTGYTTSCVNCNDCCSTLFHVPRSRSPTYCGGTPKAPAMIVRCSLRVSRNCALSFSILTGSPVSIPAGSNIARCRFCPPSAFWKSSTNCFSCSAVLKPLWPAKNLKISSGTAPFAKNDQPKFSAAISSAMERATSRTGESPSMKLRAGPRTCTSFESGYSRTVPVASVTR